MSDLIKRSDAIAEIYKVRTPDVASHQYAELFINAVRRAPSADRPQGEWEKIGEDTYYHRCPYCKRIRAFEDSRFCDWCGAQMKGADDAEDSMR